MDCIIKMVCFVLLVIGQPGGKFGLGADARTSVGKLQVYVLAGQSNMEGQAEVAKKYPNGTYYNGTLKYLLTDPRTKKEFAQTINPKTGKWTVRDDVWIWFNERGKTDNGTWGNLTVGYGVGGSPEHIGPEYGFGFTMGSALTEQILIIKTAWGGKTLAGDFRPPSSGPPGVGVYYTKMINYVHQLLAPQNLTKFFPQYQPKSGYEIAGFGWFQGWNDGCAQDMCAEYEANLVNLIKDLRKEFNAPSMKVSIPVSGFDGWGQKVDRRLEIIKAQFDTANYTRHPEFKGNVIAEETRSFFRQSEYSPSNQIYHFNHNAESYWLIGKAMAQGLLSLK